MFYKYLRFKCVVSTEQRKPTAQTEIPKIIIIFDTY